MGRSRTAVRIAASIAAVAGTTFLYARVLHVNPTTVALSLLVVILLVATRWGIAEAITTSVVSVAAFNFFFLPPAGTLTIADPQNWVAFVAFLVTAIVVSQLSGSARRREVEATARQRDLERLYALSRSLLLWESGTPIADAIARRIAEIFEVPTVGVYDQRADIVSWAGSVEAAELEDVLRDVARRATPVRDTRGIAVTAVQLGGTPIGSLAMSDAGVSDTVRQSIANLIAIGLERARAQEATARAEASRQSSELRATVLDALAHEFKTPLTAMKAAAGSLISSPAIAGNDRELVSVVDEELDRFQALVSDAVQMLRIDAGQFLVHRERHRLADIVSAVLRKFERRLEGHDVVTDVPETMPIDADRDLISLALRQLLDNAVKYSPPTSRITISAADAAAGVAVTIRNSGSAIPDAERGKIIQRFYRGAHAKQIPGTGMGLAIVDEIARAHGGTFAIASAPEGGTACTLTIPRGESRI